MLELHSATAALTAREAALLSEVEELGRTIADAKTELAALRVDDIMASHVPNAADELDAIVAHTASATHAILESCETLDDVAADLSGEPVVHLHGATTRIYEACSFQDLTGQRVTKVVSTLKLIEQKVARIVAAFGADDTSPANPAHSHGDVFLNGPQLAGAKHQCDLDRLLASFD